jgi:DNA-binding protein WhiA
MPYYLARQNSGEPGTGNISFSFNVKDEVARSIPDRKCCREAILAAFLFGRGRAGLGEISGPAVVETGFSRVARLLYRLAKDVSGAAVTWQADRERFFNKRKIYRIFIPSNEAARDFISRCSQNGHLSIAPFRRACCRRAFLAGAFLACGSVNSPERYYHFEIIHQDEAVARFLVKILAKMEITGKITGRKDDSVVYVKKAEEIANLLNILSAHNSLLWFEEVRAIKETKEEVRRKVNAETANTDKTACAATRQISSIRSLKEAGLLDKLPGNLMETATLRVRFPGASLKELGERFTPPLSKSSVNSRLRRLENYCRRVKRDDAVIA